MIVLLCVCILCQGLPNSGLAITDYSTLRPPASANDSLIADALVLELKGSYFIDDVEYYAGILVNRVKQHVKGDAQLAGILGAGANTQAVAENLVSNLIRAEEEAFVLWRSTGIFPDDIDIFGQIGKKDIANEFAATIASSLINTINSLPIEIPRDNPYIQKILLGKNPLTKLTLFAMVYDYFRAKVSPFQSDEEKALLIPTIIRASSYISTPARVNSMKAAAERLDIEVGSLSKQAISLKRQYIIAVYQVAWNGKKITEVLDAVVGLFKRQGIIYKNLADDELKKQYFIAAYAIAVRGKEAAETLGMVFAALSFFDIDFSNELRLWLRVIWQLAALKVEASIVVGIVEEAEKLSGPELRSFLKAKFTELNSMIFTTFESRDKASATAHVDIEARNLREIDSSV